MKYINYESELTTYMGLLGYDLTLESLAKLQSEYQFKNDWHTPKSEEEASEAYATSPQYLRQGRFRLRRMVLYRRVLQQLLDRSGKSNEYHGKMFAPYTVQTVLDHGCGIGDIALMLAQAGYETEVTEVVGDDGRSELLKFVSWRFARRFLPAPKAYGHNEKLPANHFDAIVSIEVFEHVWRVEETLKNLYQSLKPGGLLFLIYEWPERKLYPELPQHEQDIVKEFMETNFTQRAPFTWIKKT